ncbi:glycosyltransferase family 4 protein [Balneola sp. MJW-20]|uniref:glycosyltransferase family 4 protein n=1 Tax=Gracilimonas aurantiaca TaxID=3234185 RepID=UPI003464F84E
MELKKILIIVYYWPPSGGSGVQRWVKFVKYLKKLGWDPVIYAPSNPEYPAIDPSLDEDLPDDLRVIKRPITEPYHLYKKLVGLKKDDKLGSGLMREEGGSGLMHRLSVWIRGNFFIPDARKWWIKPSIRFLTELLNKERFDAIVTTGPPHSMHMIGLGLKKNTGLPWLADFRDPWTNIDFIEDLNLSSAARKKHEQMEQEVLDLADEIVVVSPTMRSDYSDMTDTPVTVITNGFDTNDFAPADEGPRKDHFLLTHIGMMTSTRNPETLWQALAGIRDKYPEKASKFKLQLIGKVDASIKAKIREYGLQEMVEVSDYVPHEQIIREQRKSHALLLIINESPNAGLLLPGKLFEYMASGRPVICTTPVDGDAAEVLRESGIGKVVSTYDKDALQQQILELMDQPDIYHSKELKPGSAVMKFSRQELTRKLTERLESIIS